ncbi:importin subunit beta-1 isoform X2 [Lolium perenne]|uniref:importin subunit beta-1 isoform X2 n=1 Tax=Lolium perenne TaxID=4522 RepID=UPI0021F685B9|nr:importin subunit beta-1-like isoform X2 [Lolium perenne]
MNLAEALQGALSQDVDERSEAEGDLELLREHDLPNFLLSLSSVLSSDAHPPACRKLAGIVLKNSFEAKDSSDKKLLSNKWINLDPSIKSKVKELLLASLGSPADACHISPEIIAVVAAIEMPRGEWRDLVAKLLGNMTQQGASPQLKRRTLVALGLVCEAIEVLGPEEVDGVVNAAVQGMMEPNSDVRFEAFKALYGVLGFAEVKFTNMDDMDRIMSAVCESAKSKDPGIQHAAIDCLVEIACTHFLLLQPYMATILSLTTECMKGDEKAAHPCIMVFWSAICQEVIIHRGSADAEPTADCRFIEEALSSLVPMLLEYLVTHEDLEVDLEGDDYDLRFTLGYDLRFALGYDLRCQHDRRATTRCLALIARTIGDAIVPLVMGSVQANTKASDWRRRKAAISEIRFILEGPSVEKLSPLVDLLLGMMGDPNSEVKVTTARTLGRMFELLHSPASGNGIITNANLPRIIDVLVERSEDTQNVSEKVCGAIYFLARGYEDSESMSSELPPFLDRVVEALISASEPADGTPFRLPASAYEALSEIVNVSHIREPGVTYVVEGLMRRIMKRLCMTLDRRAFALDDKEKKNNLLVRLCALLQVIIQKLRSSGMAGIVTDAAHVLLFLFCRVFASDNSAVRDKAMLAIGALANASGPDFGEHMPIFIQFYDVHLLSPISLEVIGDIFHVLEGKMLPYCDQIMEVLHKGLSESTLKPLIFSCFGDIALAIGKDFEKYLKDVLKRLKHDANLKNCADVEVDYVNQLRHGMLKAYSGILRGIKDPEIGLKVSVPLFKFIQAVCRDQSSYLPTDDCPCSIPP